jgi:1-acyl-sn-glycerol-3-phosphate acyltransferase
MVFIEKLSVRAYCMNVLTVISPGLKVLFERVGKPEVINRPDFSRLGGAGMVIACNHVGWADSLWMAYAVYQDSCAICQSKNFSVRRYHDGS